MSGTEDAVFFQFSHVIRTLHQLCDLVPLLKMLLCEYCSLSFFRQFLCWTSVGPSLFLGQLPIHPIPLDTSTCWGNSPFMKISFINSALWGCLQKVCFQSHLSGIFSFQRASVFSLLRWTYCWAPIWLCDWTDLRRTGSVVQCIFLPPLPWSAISTLLITYLVFFRLHSLTTH